jgi:type II secretory pathway pseudopilin PulG
MTVLIIIAVMSAMIVPEMQGTYQDAILRSSCRDLASLFNMVSSRAITANQVHRVRFDLTTGRYRIERCVREGAEEDEYALLTNDPDAQGALDSRVTLSILKPEDMPVDQGLDTDSDTTTEDDASMDSTNSMDSAAATLDASRQLRAARVGMLDRSVKSLNADASVDSDEDEDEDSMDAEDNTELEDPTECIVQFFPDGTAQSKVLILEDQSGFRRAFQINPYTSRVQILDAGRRL